MKFWNKKLRRCLLIKLQIKHSRHDKIFHHPLPEIFKKVDKNESFLFELMLCEVSLLQNHVRYSEEQVSLFKLKCYDVHYVDLRQSGIVIIFSNLMPWLYYWVVLDTIMIPLSLSFKIMINHYLSWWVVSDTSYNFAKVGNNFCVVIRSPASSSFQRQRQKTTKTIFVLSTVLNNGVHFRNGNSGQVRKCFKKWPNILIFKRMVFNELWWTWFHDMSRLLKWHAVLDVKF